MKNSKIVAIAALLLAVASPALAQNNAEKTDARWQAWLGCWTPSNTLIRVIGKSQHNVVCVIPGGSATSVDLLTVADGKIVDRNHVDTDAQPHNLAKEGCTGWQSAKWSASARRVYIKSEYNCTGAPATHMSAVYAMAGSGQWINVQGMRVDKNSGVRAVRYREDDTPGDLPAEIRGRLQERSLSKMAALLAVSQQPSLVDVEEASREVDASVVSTWLIEADKLNVEAPKPINARQLVQLADNGVPPSVIDVMLGLSYPNVLAVNPATYGIARQGSDSAVSQYRDVARMASMNPIIGFDRFGYPIYAADVSMLGSCGGYGYGPYDIGWSSMYSYYGCSRFGYNGFGGYGYPGYLGGSGYGGAYGGIPIVIPQGGGTGTVAAPHGKVINGRGYTQGTNTSGGSSAQPSNSTAPASSGAGAGTSAASSGSTAPPPPPRTAEPRKP